MTTLNPPPQNIPQQLRNDFITRLLRCVYTLFTAVGGADGIPRLFQSTDTPTVNPGWSTSATVNMNPPDGYFKVSTDSGEKVIPYWNT